MMWVLEVMEKAVGKARPRFNYKTKVAYTPEKTANFEEMLKWEFTSKYNVEQQPTNQPIRAEIKIQYRPPKNSSRKKMLMLDGKPYVKKPDSDNLAKSILDAFNDLVYDDDSQILGYRFY